MLSNYKKRMMLFAKHFRKKKEFYFGISDILFIFAKKLGISCQEKALNEPNYINSMMK